MARYADGFLIAVPKTKARCLPASISQKAGKVWKEHGALEYIECAGDDLKIKGGMGMPFTKVGKARTEGRRDGDLLAGFSTSRKADRDRINKKVMKDPRLTNHDGSEVDAVRHEADGLRRVPDDRRHVGVKSPRASRPASCNDRAARRRSRSDWPRPARSWRPGRRCSGQSPWRS